MNWLTTRPIAHRGCHWDKNIPENSLPAFKLAIEKNYPIELDVHLLIDNTLVVFHDDNLLRMTGTDQTIWELDLSTIQSLRLDQTLYKIPTLAEVLKIVDGKVPILIEIKNSLKVGRLETFLRKKLRDYKGEIAVQSFNPFSLEWFKTHAPEIPAGQLSGGLKDAKLSPLKKYILKNMLLNKKSKPRFISYDFNDLPSKRVDRELKKRGIPLLAWTIRSPEEREKALCFADNIIFEGKWIEETLNSLK